MKVRFKNGDLNQKAEHTNVSTDYIVNGDGSVTKTIPAGKSSGTEAPKVKGVENAAIVISNRLNKPQLVDVETLKLISDKTPIKLDPLNIEPSALALVHMTSYEPHNGMILSRREAVSRNGAGGGRNSVHFTLNHAVEAHHFGDWGDKNYAVIMPYENTVKSNTPGKFIEGLPNDLYTNGGVKIPEGAVIIKFNSSIEKGKFLISDYPDSKGVKVIETSEPPHDMVKVVLEKMNFSYSNTNDNENGMFNLKQCTTKDDFIENLTQNLKGWYDFCKTQGIKPMMHSCSTNGHAEQIIEGIDQLATTNRWTCSELKIDYKSIFIDLLSRLEKNVENGDFVSFDVSKLKDIIQNSSSPRKALKRIKSELHLIPSMDRAKNIFWMFNSRNKFRDNLSLHFGSATEVYEEGQKFFSAPEDNIDKLIKDNGYYCRKLK